MITFENVSMKSGGVTILDSVSLQIDPGELVCLSQQSGSGTSILLKMIIGALKPDSGTVSIDSADLQTVPSAAMQLLRRKTGFVLDDYMLLAYRTVAQNVAFPLEVLGEDDGTISQRVAQVLHTLDLYKHAGKRTEELSLSEQARTALARAIVHKPMILLLEEPTRHLDDEETETTLAVLRSAHASGVTVIIASSDRRLLENLPARTVTLEKGRILSDVLHTEKTHASKAVAKEPPLEEHATTPSTQTTPSRKIKVTSISTK